MMSALFFARSLIATFGEVSIHFKFTQRLHTTKIDHRLLWHTTLRNTKEESFQDFTCALVSINRGRIPFRTLAYVQENP